MSKKISIKFLYFTIIFFMLIINLLLFYQKKKNKDLISNFEMEYKKVYLENYKLSTAFFNNLGKEPLSNILLSSELSNYKTESSYNKLIFRFYNNSCSSCIEKEFANIKQNSSQIGIENIVIIATNFDNKELTASLIANGLGNIKLITKLDKEIDVVINNYVNRPYYFIVDSIGYAKMIFKPDPAFPLISEKYFKEVIKNFFSKK
jgi:hypothetical protein